MIVVQWVVSVVFLGLFLWLAVLNGVVAWKIWLKRVAASSWIPLLGGVFGELGLALLPVPNMLHYWIWPLLLDYGCVPGLLHTLVWHLHARRR
ncbi:MAG TPA: hypothetical protein VGK19_19210 [Capsulimonadaceae bacterium]|jgi:hypothetical protein